MLNPSPKVEIGSTSYFPLAELILKLAKLSFLLTGTTLDFYFLKELISHWENFLAREVSTESLKWSESTAWLINYFSEINNWECYLHGGVFTWGLGTLRGRYTFFTHHWNLSAKDLLFLSKQCPVMVGLHLHLRSC